MMDHCAKFKIYIDIDGVLADFDRHLDAHGLRAPDGQAQWNKLSLAWWRTIPFFKGAQDFFIRISAVVETRFLTAPTVSTDCFTGKADWVQAFLPHEGKGALKRLMIVSGVDKADLAGPKRILIDDRQKNIDEWVAAGGIGILFTGDFAAVERQLTAIIPGLSMPADAQAVIAARKSTAFR